MANGNGVFLRMITYACVCITRLHAIISYTSIYLSVPRPTQDIMNFSHFSKRLERFCSMPLLYIATMVQTSRMPRFSFWNECYRFAPNSKFHSARKDREMDERVELSRRKYSRRRVCSQNLASLVAKV